MHRQILFLLVPLALSPSFVSAQVTLEQKFYEGTKFVIQNEEKAKYVMLIAGMNLETNWTVFNLTTTSVGKRDDKGSLKLEEKADTLQYETALPGGLSFRFDLATPDKKPEIPDLEWVVELLRTQCLPVTITLDSRNKVESAKLPDGEFEKLSAPSVGTFKPESLKKTAERQRAYLPDEPVKQGDIWERSTETQLGDGHVLYLRTKFEYAGTIEQDGRTLDKITGKVLEVTYAIDANTRYQMTAEEMKVGESASQYLFDRERGALVSRTSILQIIGKMTITVGGQKLPGTLDWTIEETSIRQK